jgi:hypothetical protein
MDAVQAPADAWTLIWPCLVVLGLLVTWEATSRLVRKQSARKHRADLISKSAPEPSSAADMDADVRV